MADETVNRGDQLSGLPVDTLIGGPLSTPPGAQFVPAEAPLDAIDRRAEAEETSARRRAPLGAELLNRLATEDWMGLTGDQISAYLGEPTSKDTRVSESRTTEIWRYEHMGSNRDDTRITVEGGVVTGWEIDRA